MINLFDLSASFWRDALGGKDPLQGYDLTMDRIDRLRGMRTIVCCDSPRSIRKEQQPTYKSNREAKPEAAIDALRAVHNRVLDLGIPIACVEGWEADDVIATLVEQAWPEEVVILGAEKDFYCLLAHEHVVRLVGPRGPVDASHCVDKFGVKPEQMTDWLALAGDPADGVPGCPNCGPGRASDLLLKFCTLMAVKAATYDELRSVRGIGEKTAASIQEWDPAPTLELVRLRTDLPISLLEILHD